jgi:ribosomal protein S18 acetylase RimI-like enzyme
MTFALRPATPADADWLFQLRRATMRTYVEETFGVWDDRSQRNRFRQRRELADIQIIMVGEQPAGLLHVERGPAGVFLANIQIEPQFQNRSLGTAVIRSILAEGRRAGTPVRLQVLKVNRAARRLYERLGFVVRDETGTHVRMIWLPA